MEHTMKVTRQFLLSLALPLAFLLFCIPTGGSAAHATTCNWRVVSSPNPSTQTFNSLNAIAAVSASNIWAVGTAELNGSPNQAIIEHWNGTTWNLVSTQLKSSVLNSIAVISASDIWAVGGSGQTLTAHWNGTTWTTVASPNPSSESFLTGVSAIT